MDLDKLQTDYQALVPLAARFCSALPRELMQLFSAKGIVLGVPMESRIKSWTSIAEKMKRRSLTLGTVKDLNDLIGLRIILLFRRDLTAACHIIEKTFHVVDKEDASARLAEMQFGYQSLHYIIELPKEWLAVPSFQDFSGFRAEIQARTLAQHIWAASSHILQYKLEQSAPAPVRRSIHRVSQLLETAHLEFERALNDPEEY